MKKSRAALVLVSLLLPALATAQDKDAPRATEDDVLLVVTFSGGGIRAAAFGFGVVQALRETAAGDRRFVDRIDRVAGVSGGSFMAAQLATDASPEALARFHQKILLTDIEAELLKSAAANSLKLVRRDYNRSDAAAAYYGALFDDMTLADLEGRGPELWIQATELAAGQPLVFRPVTLRHLGLASSQITVGQAIAASAAVPGAMPPLNLHIPDHTPAECPEAGCPVNGDPPAVSLADGGIVDNLGLEVLFRGDVPRDTRAVIVIVVNSRRGLSIPWKLDSSGLISAGYTVSLQQRRIDCLMLDHARERLRVLELESRLEGRDFETKLVVVSFEGSEQKEALDKISTRFHLEKAEVRLLIDEGRAQMLRRLREIPRYWEQRSKAATVD